jgi:hypothetical protein
MDVVALKVTTVDATQSRVKESISIVAILSSENYAPPLKNKCYVITIVDY